jgi:hypothetical protein
MTNISIWLGDCIECAACAGIYIMGEKNKFGIYGYITSTGPPFTTASIAREQFFACTIFT